MIIFVSFMILSEAILYFKMVGTYVLIFCVINTIHGREEKKKYDTKKMHPCSQKDNYKKC